MGISEASVKIPSKISDGHLKESIVEIKFELNVAFEVFIGKIHDDLINLGLEYSRPNFNFKESKVIDFDAIRPFFRNENHSIWFTSNSISFSCVEKYSGWEEFYEFIIKGLEAINKSGTINQYFRIGLRFINVFENLNLFDILIDPFRVNIDAFETNSTSILTKIKDNEFPANLRIENNLESPEGKDISKIDIDVYYSSLETKSGNITFDNIPELINSVHDREKKIFFYILKEDYINKELNPTY